MIHKCNKKYQCTNSKKGKYEQTKQNALQNHLYLIYKLPQGIILFPKLRAGLYERSVFFIF